MSARPRRPGNALKGPRRHANPTRHRCVDAAHRHPDRDVAFVGESYLDNLERAAQLLVDQGEEVLVPSLRPSGAWQVVVGDRLSDPDWAAINVARDSYLSAAPEQIATLSNVLVEAAQLTPAFRPHHHAYTVLVDTAVSRIAITPTATSGRHRQLTVDGEAHRSGTTHWVQLGAGEPDVTITVTSPDGTASQTYTLAVRRTAA